MNIGLRLVVCSLPFLLLAYVIGIALIGNHSPAILMRRSAWVSVFVGFSLAAAGTFVWAATA